MLRHDDNPEAASFPSAAFSSPAAQVRVTPQELATALARLEARQGGLEGTIPLGDAVQELGLAVTPEELLREIEAGRTHPQATQKQIRPASRFSVGITLSLAFLLFIGGIFFLRSIPSQVALVPAQTITAVTPAVQVRPAPITVPSNLLVRRSDHQMVLLSEVADNQPVLCELTGTETGAQFADFAAASSHWTLIKHDGKVYVRGWIGDLSDAALRSTVVSIHPLAVYVTPGLHPVPVTLPVDGFQSPPGMTSDDMISASHLVPDARHLKEKW